MEKLKKYNEKRDFDKTLEPKGKVRKRSQKKLIFIIQRHIARREHYDFRLEWNGVLLSWAVPKGPSYNPKDKRLAIQVEDHPISYATFEGVIPQGEYGGGTVMLWDEGTWEPLENNVDEALKKGSIKLELFGKRLKGKWALVKLKNADDKNNWILIKEKDDLSKKEYDISRFDTSIKTGRTIKEIAENKSKKKVKNPFDKISIQLLKASEKVPVGENWIYELKYDGYRIITYLENGEIKLFTRNHINCTSKFKNLSEEIQIWANNKSMVLDGEIIVVDEQGKPSFQLLQNYLKNKTSQQVTYIIFDILALDGQDLRQKTLKERRLILKKILQNAPECIIYSKEINGSGVDIFVSACKLGAEGIVAKKSNSIYSGKRNGDWVKIKCINKQEFVIGGYTLTEKKANGVSSLLLGYYVNEKLIFVGRVGTGFTDKERVFLEDRFKKFIQDKNSFNIPIKARVKEKVFFLKPKLVCEVEYAELTSDGILRHASYKGLREDKNSKSVILETATINKVDIKVNKKNKIVKKNEATSIAGITITNPERVIFKNADIKKIDIVNYYVKVSERLMRFLENRIVSIKRCPKGIDQTCFFERNYSKKMGAGISKSSFKNSSGEKVDYFSIKNLEGLINQVQLNTIEFHIWGCKANKIKNPDIMTFDLDPDENMQIEEIRQGVKDLKSILNKLSLKSFLKTSGGKGYHILVPLKPALTWKKFSEFAKNVAKLMEQTWPEKYTSNMRKANRKGKIFIDWVRNTKSATSVAPYSVRIRENATVSMPIRWSELDKVAPDQINISQALERLKKADPWENFFKIKQELK